ncbi:MFS transporter [Ferdinandcohnia quinoae]|uniref:MFS transporter n=1 Tax=Fredinandcohnia quinoae TaxID=2918902 RepID=A0AAW5E486_9BACI|nr:MFS transporter [Fredinandcohnia sp. SECRCQ15]MCH1625609.1 MFS transporter [Fredinandcohnia sp. SECRCQ15]
MDIFKNRNFMAMFLGRIITNIGDSLYMVAAVWLVYDLSGSTFYTGLAGFLSIIPRVIQFLSGPLIDKLPIKSILVYTQLIQALLLLIIPTAAYFNVLNVTLVLIITPILSTLNMFVYPAQIAALPKIVNEDQLTKGNSLFSIAYQGIDIVCNSVAGTLIVLIGATSLYTLDSMTFLIGAIIFSFIKLPKAKKEVQQTKKSISVSIKNYGADLREGVKIIGHSALSRLLFGIIVVNLVIGAIFAVLPAFSDRNGGPEMYGLLLMAGAIGGLIGAFSVTPLKLEKIPLGKLYAGAFLLAGLAWALSIFTPWLWLTIAVYGFAWIPGGATNVIIFTVIQKGVPKQLIGRVTSISIALSGIAAPLGGLLGGSLGVFTSSSVIIFFAGLAVVIVGVYWILDSTTRNLPSTEVIDESLFGFDEDKRIPQSPSITL